MPTALRCLCLIPLLSFVAGAVVKGGSLYIRADNTPLLKDPSAKARKLATLNAGDEVVWNGVSEKDPLFHEVAVGGNRGFVARGDLMPHKPQARPLPTSPEAVPFALSGAANKGGAPQFTRTPEHQQAEDELRALEALNLQVATPSAVEAKRKALQAR